MCTALEFRVFVAGSALQFLIFMDRIATKDVSNSFVILLLVTFLLHVHSLPSLGVKRVG